MNDNLFVASPMTRALVSSDAPRRSPSELHAMKFLARYRNPRTRNGYAITLRQWFGWIAALEVEPLEATRSHIDLFCRDLEMHGRTNSTVAAKMNALAGYYRFAVIDRLIDENPMEHVERPKIPRVSTTLGLSRAELADLVRALDGRPARDQAMVLLLAYNGMRVSEVAGIDIEHVSRHEGQPVVQILRKGGKVQVVPMAPRTAWQVELAIGQRQSGPLFTTKTGHRVDRRVIGRTVSQLCIGAGITKRITPHSLRHTFVTLSLDAGRSERDIAVSVGHADTRLVAYYDRGRDSIVRNTTHSVAALVEGTM